MATARIMKKRHRFFFAGEGESEQSFVRWLQELAEQNGLHVHLHCEPLGGGGYPKMIKRAVAYRKRGLSKGIYKQSYLLVDGDRAVSGNDWSLDQLKQEASTNGFSLYLSIPSLEIIFLRMFPRKENATAANASLAISQLVTAWPNYQKPVDARTLGQKFSIDDIRRVAAHDVSLQTLLRQIGLFN